MLSLISLFQIIAVIFDPKSFLRITASTANVVAVNLDDIKILLANDLSVFLIKKSQFLAMVLEIYLEITLIAFFEADEFLLAGELFAKALQSLETCLPVNNIL